jgi:hypothetical protein
VQPATGSTDRVTRLRKRRGDSREYVVKNIARKHPRELREHQRGKHRRAQDDGNGDPVAKHGRCRQPLIARAVGRQVASVLSQPVHGGRRRAGQLLFHRLRLRVVAAEEGAEKRADVSAAGHRRQDIDTAEADAVRVVLFSAGERTQDAETKRRAPDAAA